jgi:hypothetical protein
MAGEGSPRCKAPMLCMALLKAQRSCNNLYYPLAFFMLQK